MQMKSTDVQVLQANAYRLRKDTHLGCMLKVLMCRRFSQLPMAAWQPFGILNDINIVHVLLANADLCHRSSWDAFRVS